MLPAQSSTNPISRPTVVSANQHYHRELQPMFRPACEHAIRLNRRFGNQIVNQHADVRLIAAKNELIELRSTHCVSRRINSRDHSLRCGFFVSAGSINLPGQKKSRHAARFAMYFESASAKPCHIPRHIRSGEFSRFPIPR